MNEAVASVALSRVKGMLCGALGAVILAFSVFADPIFGTPFSWGKWQTVGCVAGLMVGAVGLTRTTPAVSRILINFAVVSFALLGSLFLAELFFRAIGYDFGAKAWAKVPIFFRQPTVLVEEVFFRRPGPAEWHGQVLNARVRQLGLFPNPYPNEPPVTIRYDAEGFRNPPGLKDWEIAIAGDSFTELGYLPDESLYTTIIGNILGLRVKNLGTSYTGPLSQVCYLKNFGASPHTRHWVMVFFEGNDLDDAVREYEALLRWQKTGEREKREVRNTSLLKALRQVLTQSDAFLKRRADNAIFSSPVLGRVPVTLRHTPPNGEQLSLEVKSALEYAFQRYAASARGQKILPWVAFMPSKERVLYGKVEFLPHAPEELRAWKPTNLPEFVRGLCEKHGIRFIDL